MLEEQKEQIKLTQSDGSSGNEEGEKKADIENYKQSEGNSNNEEKNASIKIRIWLSKCLSHCNPCNPMTYGHVAMMLPYFNECGLKFNSNESKRDRDKFYISFHGGDKGFKSYKFDIDDYGDSKGYRYRIFCSINT